MTGIQLMRLVGLIMAVVALAYIVRRHCGRRWTPFAIGYLLVTALYCATALAWHLSLLPNEWAVFLLHFNAAVDIYGITLLVIYVYIAENHQWT